MGAKATDRGIWRRASRRVRVRVMDDSLPPNAMELLEHSGETGPDIKRLRELCPDPMQLFVLCPHMLRARDLAQLYCGDVSNLIATLQAIKFRMTSERWNEKRAVFQAKRFKARQDAVIEAEATVMAIMAVDYHGMRMRSLMSRYESLTSHVEEQLMRCASGERPFTPDLRDACREVRELESVLNDLMPAMGTEERASRLLVANQERREELIETVARQLGSLRGADSGRRVLELVRVNGAPVPGGRTGTEE